MPVFKYIAKDKDGKTVSGSLDAASSRALVESLRQRELIIIQIEEEKEKTAKSAAGGGGGGGGGGRIKMDELGHLFETACHYGRCRYPLVGVWMPCKTRWRQGVKNVIKKSA